MSAVDNNKKRKAYTSFCHLTDAKYNANKPVENGEGNYN